MSKLVAAEKPSVAQSLARVIGATKRQDGYGAYGNLLTMGGLHECEEWLNGVVFDDPQVSNRVEISVSAIKAQIILCAFQCVQYIAGSFHGRDQLILFRRMIV